MFELGKFFKRHLKTISILVLCVVGVFLIINAFGWQCDYENPFEMTGRTCERAVNAIEAAVGVGFLVGAFLIYKSKKPKA